MKKDMLRDADYRYNFDRDIYFNRRDKKVFSLEFVSDASEEELTRRMREATSASGWTFYFNAVPSESVKRELESVLG